MEAKTKHFIILLFFFPFFLLLNSANAKIHYHRFTVKEKQVKILCNTTTIVTVNGQFPGPTLVANNGDTLVIKVLNMVNYNISIHWHGLKQNRNGWADGTSYVTQCPIMYGRNFTYRFTIEDQEGTFWWHAHNHFINGFLYGALIVLPKKHFSYPFIKPHREIPIIISGWWSNKDMIKLGLESLENGNVPEHADGTLINGRPGHLLQSSCSETSSSVFSVFSGETVLLRFINSAIDSEYFITISNHTMTVVAIDGSYTKPFDTSYILLSPGQTTDVLLHTDQLPNNYYIAAGPYASGAPLIPFNSFIGTAIIEYEGNSTPLKPEPPFLPAYNDRTSAGIFRSKLKSLNQELVPCPVDEHLFIVVSFGLSNCPMGRRCAGPFGYKAASSMNNVSFVRPRASSLLQAMNLGQSDVFTADFPSSPPLKFDYTGNNTRIGLQLTLKGTKVFRVKYGAVVEVVLQGTSVGFKDDHPIHLHGYDFYVLALGMGNFEREKDEAKFNLFDPPKRNTVEVPAGGWVVIRFLADNPGMWLMHCHIDVHFSWGMAMAFMVENGETEMESINPPPLDLPQC